MGWRIKDKITVDPSGEDLLLLEQNNNSRSTTFSRLKNWLLGTAELTTTDKTSNGAINEINTKVGSIDVENDGDVASQLNERTIKTYYNLSQIGLTDSNLAEKTQNEIADIIINAMPNNSTLELYLSSTTTTNIGILLPIRYDGILRIYKDTIKGCKFSFTSQTNRTFDSFYASWKTPTLVGWNEISIVNDTGWIELPLLNGATTTSDKAIYRRIGKMVYFKGVVNNITTNDFIFGNLPIGFRPNSASGGGNIPIPLFLPGEDSPSRLVIYQNGNLQLTRKNDRNTCYLDGVMFVLD